jgi:hypothetical protein
MILVVGAGRLLLTGLNRLISTQHSKYQLRRIKMSDVIKTKAQELDELLKADLGQIETSVLTSYTLADAIREGCLVTTKEEGWGNGETACAMSAAVIAAVNRGYIEP